jgi:putative ABC transport system substrate-binding protein
MITLTNDEVGWKVAIRPAFRKWLCRAIIHAQRRIGGLGMRRRNFMTVLAGAAAYPLLAGAQQKAMPVIGFLAARSPNARQAAAFYQGLSEAGYVEGQNLATEYRWAEGRFDRLPALAADLVGRKVDVILAVGGVSALAAKAATSTVPIVFIVGRDPVEFGLVASLARPGGNLTGFNELLIELTPKRLELVPQVGAIAVLVNPTNSNAERIIRDAQEAAHTKGVRAHILEASTESEIDTAFATLVQLQAGALLVGTDAFFETRGAQLVALASLHKVPAIYEMRGFVEADGLISYGMRFDNEWHQVGDYLRKILNGTKPADLPAQQPTISELVVNLKTAKALGLTIPPSILARADEVIEQ